MRWFQCCTKVWWGVEVLPHCKTRDKWDKELKIEIPSDDWCNICKIQQPAVDALQMFSSLQLGSGVPKRGESRLRCSCGLSVVCPQCCHVGISWKHHYFHRSNSQYLGMYVLSPSHNRLVTHRYDADSLDNGTLPTDKSKTMEKSVEDLSKSASNSPTHSAPKTSKAFAVRWGRLWTECPNVMMSADVSVLHMSVFTDIYNAGS